MTGTVTIELLERWRDGGAVWRLRELTPDRARVELCSCTGEPMDEVESADPQLIAYVRDHAEAD
jgi:hypothetical protein